MAKSAKSRYAKEEREYLKLLQSYNRLKSPLERKINSKDRARLRERIMKRSKLVKIPLLKKFGRMFRVGYLPPEISIFTRKLDRQGNGVFLCKYNDWFFSIYKFSDGPGRYHYELSEYPICWTLDLAKLYFKWACDKYHEIASTTPSPMKFLTIQKKL